MKTTIFLAENELTGEKQYLNNISEVKRFLKTMVAKNLVKKKISKYQPWDFSHKETVCKTDKEFLDNALSHLKSNEFGNLYLNINKRTTHCPDRLKISTLKLEPSKSKFPNLYNEEHDRQETSLINGTRTIWGLYSDVGARRQSVDCYFSNKKDESFHLFLYHDGKEETIDALHKKVKSLIANKSIPYKWFKSQEYIYPPFIITMKNLKKLDTWIKNQ